MLTLGGIFEFVPAVMGQNLKGSLLLLQIESGLTIHTRRALRTELLDSRGEPARSTNGRLLMPPISRPITLRRLSPSWTFLVSTATVRFEQDVRLMPGEYHFRFHVDGQEFGERVDLTVVPPE